MALPEDNKKFLRDVLGPDPLGTILKWVEENFEPDQVYNKAYLLEWAEENRGKDGYK